MENESAETTIFVLKQRDTPSGATRWLTDGWRLRLTAPGSHHQPDTLPDMLLNREDTIDACVPGTVAAALEHAGRFDRTSPRPLHDSDVWYETRLAGEVPGSAILSFGGLATLAEIFLNGEPILSSDSMFLSHDVPVTLTGDDRLSICFRALLPSLARKGPRARWRTKLITAAGLRLTRTTLLGFMPGWCPEIHAVGPWRAIGLRRSDPSRISDLQISSRLDADGTGRLTVSFLAAAPTAFHVRCAGGEAAVTVGDDGRALAELSLPDIEPWWPQTHGRPALHDIHLMTETEAITIGRTGFRRLAVDRQADGQGFSIEVNGVPVFCRGAAWTSADIVALPGGRDDYRPWLTLAAEAGMNMIRIGGTMAYETPEFFALCDELGLMVWQDCMLANFDYPVADDALMTAVRAEVTQLLGSTRASPSLTVLCGGSEVYQQAAMLGLPERVWAGPLTETVLPEIAAAIRPDILYVPNSPFGGAMPFSPNASVTHYYGVGAYCRPLEDARRANVRFAAECLAFANVPEQITLSSHLDVPPVHDPRWKARVPRDRDASWDFEDIREHYLQDLFAVDPVRLRREDSGRYLALSRVVTGEVMEATYAEWRRKGSSCGGALVWTFQDLLPGAGWGVVDATGLPKPAWHALRRAFRPIQILLLDEGTNGVDVHVINETGEDRVLTVDLSCLHLGSRPVVSGQRTLTVEARSSLVIPATDLFGAFFDTAYSYRFAAPQHDVTVARLSCGKTGAYLADAFHFPRGRKTASHASEIEVRLLHEDGNYRIEASTSRFALSVQVDAPGFAASDNWFHLAPGHPHSITLRPLDPAQAARPTGALVDLAGTQFPF